MIIRRSIAVAAAIIAATSANTTLARSPLPRAISGPIKYCATVTTNSRVSRKVCLTEQEWLNQGVKLPFYMPLI